MSTLLCVCATSFFGATFGGGDVPEIAAKRWWNNPEYRITDNRRVVLFFFSTRDRNSSAVIGRLNKLHRQRGSVVIGLTKDGDRETETFVRSRRVRFTVGSRSDCFAGFGVRKTPKLLTFSRADSKSGFQLTELAIEDIGDLDIQDDEPPLDVSEMTEPAQWIAYAQGHDHGITRCRAISKLYQSLDSDAFSRFAAKLLETDGDPWVRNALDLYLTRPSEEAVEAMKHAEFIQHERDFEASPDSPKYAEFRAYIHAVHEGRSAEQMVADYWAHGKSEPVDVLIRSWVARRMSPSDPEKQPDLRESLMQMIGAEEDWGIRSVLALKLTTLCSVGDVEAADFLAELARSEENLLLVKPVLEYGSYYLRTGVDDPADFPVPTDPD